MPAAASTSQYSSMNLTAAVADACVPCRVYCVLLRPDVEALLAAKPPLDCHLQALVVGVHALDSVATQWCGSNIGEPPHPGQGQCATLSSCVCSMLPTLASLSAQQYWLAVWMS